MNESGKKHVGATLSFTTAACALILMGPLPVSSSAPKSPAGAAATTPAPGGPSDRRESARDPHDNQPPQRDSVRDQFRAPTTQERDEAIEFFRQHMKFRMSILEQVPEGRPVRHRMMQMMMDRYRRLQRARMEDATMFDLMLEQMHLQDDALRLLQEQRFNRNDQPTVDRLEEELRVKVRQIIDLSLQERQKRITRLEQQLADQKTRLEQDLANPDSLVERQVTQMRNDADDFGRIRRQLGIVPNRGGFTPQRPPATDRTDRQDGNR